MKSPIIPIHQQFYGKRTYEPVDWNQLTINENDLDYENICYFVACGFFPGDATYDKNTKVLQPASEIRETTTSKTIDSYWEWYYKPRDISFKQAVEEFGHLFEKLSRQNISDDQTVILPLSGGLDSRTQAAALKDHPNVQAFTYQFPGGKQETKYGRAIAETYGFPFQSLEIPRGYLWDCVEDLARINSCFTDFTHPRQMAFKQQIGQLGDVFHLGHWGDVLFDDMGVRDDLSFEHQVTEIFKKVTKPAGLELGARLWEVWGLQGDFQEALKDRIRNLLVGIQIENANARIRAFKSLYWAPRWTSVNLNVFADEKPVHLPYYQDEMCKFICTLPERYLVGRQMQMAYLKEKAPELAKLPWQPVDPFNLYNYQKFDSKAYLPVRAIKKGKRLFNEKVLRHPQPVQRNWELQFLGEANNRYLRGYLFNNPMLNEMVPKSLISDFYHKFQYKGQVQYSHAVSMLLTLSSFSKRQMRSTTDVETRTGRETAS